MNGLSRKYVLMVFVSIGLLAGCIRAEKQTTLSEESKEVVIQTVVVTATSESKAETAVPTTVVEPTDVPPIYTTVEIPYNRDRGYEITYDENKWVLNPDAHQFNDVNFLTHKTTSDCVIYLPVPRGLGENVDMTREIVTMGNIRWSHLVSFGVYTLMDDPNTVQLEGYFEDETCKRDAYEVLSTVKFNEELTKVDCPGAPESRITAPAQVKIINNVVLRSSPEKNDSNILGNMAVGGVVSIIGGPVCGQYEGGAYLYWKVTLIDQTRGYIEGWIAEGRPDLYFLELL